METAEWYFAENGQSVGPMTLTDLVARLPGPERLDTLVYGPGLATWTPARRVPGVAARLTQGMPQPGAFATRNLAPPAPPSRRSDEIDYEIRGEEMQYVEITLDPGETVLAEAGSMFYMTQGIKMETVFGDPSAPSGRFMDKLMTAGKRALTGESMFVTTFQNIGARREQVAFAAPYPGCILAMHLDQLGGELICQKDSFLCAAKGVQINVAFQRKFGVGLFGGEGFIMQRLSGDGIALVHAGGMLLQRDLAAGETLRVDTGCLVALQPSVNYDIQFIGGFKNTLFGGEGLFFATLTGPGKVWLQSLPFARLAGRVLANAGPSGGHDEGSLLGRAGTGGIAGLAGGTLLGGLLGSDDS